jgi:hypothetical protein
MAGTSTSARSTAFVSARAGPSDRLAIMHFTTSGTPTGTRDGQRGEEQRIGRYEHGLMKAGQVLAERMVQPTLPPMELSTCARSVVGTCTT